MILAAGLGTRMGPISRYLAKPAVPFLGVPLIEHSVGVLRAAGIRDIIVNLHHLPQTVRDVLGDGSRAGVSISYSLEDPILGTGGGIGNARNFFGNETFVVINSDVMMDIDLPDMLAAHGEKGAVATLAVRPDDSARYGTVRVDRCGRLRQIEGNPAGADVEGCRTLMFAGLQVIEPRWFDYAPERRVYDSIRDVYAQALTRGEKIYCYEYAGRWIDVGSARRLLAATLEGLVGSLIPSGAEVGADTRVRRSVLTPRTAIGEGCAIERVLFLGEARVDRGSTLINCILCPGARVPSGSVIRDAIVADGERTPLEELPQ